MTMNAGRFALGLGWALLGCTGCTSTHPIRSWQDRLTAYTTREAGGDLNVLRESSELRASNDLRPAQIRFDHTDISKGGIPPFSDRQDAHGVMVGQHISNGHPVFFFLVGVVERPYGGGPSRVEDIRLVSCRVHDGKHHWKTSRSDPKALEAYGRGARGADRANPGAGARTFPLVDDHFEFLVSGGTATARDVRSGASWELPLN